MLVSSPDEEALEDDFALAGGFLMLRVRGVLHQRAAHGVVALVIRGLTVPATDGALELVPGAVDGFGAPFELPVIVSPSEPTTVWLVPPPPDPTIWIASLPV